MQKCTLIDKINYNRERVQSKIKKMLIENAIFIKTFCFYKLSCFHHNFIFCFVFFFFGFNNIYR